MNQQLPIPAHLIATAVAANHIEQVGRASIREIRALIDYVEARQPVRFIRMEMGIPGLPVDRIALEAEVAALQRGVAAAYPPIAGVPELKQEIAAFVRNFLNVEIGAEFCLPTVGTMMAGFATFMVAGRARAERDHVLFLNPGFPLHGAQATMVGLKQVGIDVYDHRGAAALRAALQGAFESVAGRVGVLLYSNPNNPSWICFTEEELQAIAAFADEHQIIVVEDLAYFAMDFRQELGRPGQPPYQPTVAHYTENYVLMISSSKAFSYAGQRVGMLCVSPTVAQRRYPDLRRFFQHERLIDALVLGALYGLCAGVGHSAQYGLAALLRAANTGALNFVEEVKVYGRKAAAMKEHFLRHGFSIVYDTDVDRPIADGFYFTVSYPGLSGEALLEQLLYYGISAIALSTTGSSREGIRACVSLVPEGDIPELGRRLALFAANHLV